VIPADLRDVDDVLAQTGRLLDFREPVGLLLVAVLHNIADSDDPAGIAARSMSAQTFSVRRNTCLHQALVLYR
jgi:S-adenosyl methyltransferase